MFNIGDRVESVANIRAGLKGRIRINEGDQGTVCAPPGLYDRWRSVGVCWDRYINGHSCSGHCTVGHGWAVGEDELELCHDTDDPFEFDEEDFEKLILAKSASGK